MTTKSDKYFRAVLRKKLLPEVAKQGWKGFVNILVPCIDLQILFSKAEKNLQVYAWYKKAYDKYLYLDRVNS